MDEEWGEVVSDEEFSRRFLPVDPFVLGLGLARGISEAFTETLRQAERLAVYHANHLLDRAAFHEEAALEIEKMTGGTDG